MSQRDDKKSRAFMRSSLPLFLVCLALLGCQGASTGSVGGTGGGLNPVGPGNPGSGNALDKTQDPATLSDTPQTISTSPVMGSVIHPNCPDPNPLCFTLKVQVYDPEECPGNSIFFSGRVGSIAPDTVFAKVELTIQYPGNSTTPQVVLDYQDPDTGMLFGEYRAFIDAQPGDLVKISARRKDHPEETPITKEINLDNPIRTKSGYQGSCNPALIHLVAPTDVQDAGN